MVQHRLSRELAEATVREIQKLIDEDGYKAHGSPSAVLEYARRIKKSPSTVWTRVHAAKQYFQLELKERAFEAPVIEVPLLPPNLADIVRNLLILSPKTMEELCARTKASPDDITKALDELKHINLHKIGDRFEIRRQMQPTFIDHECVLEVTSDKQNRFIFGVVSDNHCGSKYERRDVLEELYDRFAAANVTKVFHTGNWIDGEASFNRYDLVCHGVEQQCKLLAETYPQREGITTYAVTGDDHEGWYAQREGINVGDYAVDVMRRAGRADWVNLGYMEAHVRLKNLNSGASAMMAVVHPGGGSSYALSYAVQKIIESLEGGEKPAVGLYGHYHKHWAGNIRNVWCLITACCQDQTPFMRKKKLEAHVGGTLLKLEQDPVTGAITGFMPDMRRYFTRGFYQGRWSHHDSVVQPERSIGGL